MLIISSVNDDYCNNTLLHNHACKFCNLEWRYLSSVLSNLTNLLSSPCCVWCWWPAEGWLSAGLDCESSSSDSISFTSGFNRWYFVLRRECHCALCNNVDFFSSIRSKYKLSLLIAIQGSTVYQLRQYYCLLGNIVFQEKLKQMKWSLAMFTYNLSQKSADHPNKKNIHFNSKPSFIYYLFHIKMETYFI